MMLNKPSVRLLLLLPALLLPGCSDLATRDRDVETGAQLYRQRKFAEAVPHFERALGGRLKSHERSEVLTIIGNCYNELEQYEKSLDYHHQAIQQDPKNHQAFVNLGVVYRLMGDFDKAKESYAKAIELEPEYAEAHASLGALAIFENRFAEALKHLEKAIQLDDSLAVAHSNLAFAYASVGRFDEADTEFKAAVIRGYHRPEVIQERIDQLRKLPQK